MPVGYLYLNPDTGTEFSKDHPVRSGEVTDAENIRVATAEVLRDALLEAWQLMDEQQQQHDAQIVMLNKQMNARPTEFAYGAACKALAHWRKEAKRLGKLAGVAPREMKHKN